MRCNVCPKRLDNTCDIYAPGESDSPCILIRSNGDRYRTMSNREIAQYFRLAHVCDQCPAREGDCKEDNNLCELNWREYLDKEAK